MGEVAEAESCIGTVEDPAAECGCFTKLHFTSKNVCIQDLRPNHYDPTFCGADAHRESKFVASIIESRFCRERADSDFLATLNGIENVKNIFDEIKLGFKDDEDVGVTGAKLQYVFE